MAYMDYKPHIWFVGCTSVQALTWVARTLALALDRAERADFGPVMVLGLASVEVPKIPRKMVSRAGSTYYIYIYIVGMYILYIYTYIIYMYSRYNWGGGVGWGGAYILVGKWTRLCVCRYVRVDMGGWGGVGWGGAYVNVHVNLLGK